LNDEVVLKLRSADVTHGFSLKSYDIYIPGGIEPGRTRYVRFKADREGSFLFTCTVFCGDVHHTMQGMLKVEK
jgi:heme/copper-type cytochrome/quinol oxidase subunit 2